MKDSNPEVWLIHGSGSLCTIITNAKNSIFQETLRNEIRAGKTPSQALDLVIAKSPEIYEAWLKAGAGPLDLSDGPILIRAATFPEAIQALVKDGKTRSEALDIVMAKCPNLWEDWLRAGAAKLP